MSSQLSMNQIQSDVNNVCKMIKAQTPVIVLDAVATGFDPETDKIISLSALKIVEKEKNFPYVVDEMNILINPEKDIPEKILHFGGLDKKDLLSKPTEDKVFSEIREFLGSEPLVFNYNKRKKVIPFIDKMYQRHRHEEFKPALCLDVMDMSRCVLDIDVYDVSSVAKELGVHQHLQKNTMGNCIGTYRIFRVIKEEFLHTPADPIGEESSDCVMGTKYWIAHDKKSARVLVLTTPISNTYFDLVRREWHTDNDQIILDDVRRQVLNKWQVSNEEEMIKKLKAYLAQKNECSQEKRPSI